MGTSTVQSFEQSFELIILPARVLLIARTIILSTPVAERYVPWPCCEAGAVGPDLCIPGSSLASQLVLFIALLFIPMQQYILVLSRVESKHWRNAASPFCKSLKMEFESQTDHIRVCGGF